jgi:REP element-mobilizing transposase RayT
MEYRRAKTPGGTFFFTVVTHNRRKFLYTSEIIRQIEAGRVITCPPDVGAVRGKNAISKHTSGKFQVIRWSIETPLAQRFRRLSLTEGT